jgi:hypothetical protein
MVMKAVPWIIITCLLSACIAAPTPQPTATTALPSVLVSADNSFLPEPGDANLTQAGVELESINLVERVDMNPVRVEVDFIGSLPTTCNQLRMEVGLPNEQYQINIKIYSIVKPDPKCEQVLQQFSKSILLGVYSNGRYTVWVNGGLVGDFVVY